MKVIDSAMKILDVIQHSWLLFIVVLLESSCDWQWCVVEFVLSFSLNLILRIAEQHNASSVGTALFDTIYEWHGSYWTKSNHTRFSMCFLMCCIIGPLMSGAYPFYATSPSNSNKRKGSNVRYNQRRREKRAAQSETSFSSKVTHRDLHEPTSVLGDDDEDRVEPHSSSNSNKRKGCNVSYNQRRREKRAAQSETSFSSEVTQRDLHESISVLGDDDEDRVEPHSSSDSNKRKGSNVRYNQRRREKRAAQSETSFSSEVTQRDLQSQTHKSSKVAPI
jgi:hypothetical protein